MLVYLFWWSSERERIQGRPIVPVSFDDPDTVLEPFFISATPARVAWLESYNHPTWLIGEPPMNNARRMHMLTGCWPEPILISCVEPVPDEFNDELPV